MKFNDTAVITEVALFDFDPKLRCFVCETKCTYDKSKNTLTCPQCAAVGEIDQRPASDGSGTVTNIWWTKGGANEQA